MCALPAEFRVRGHAVTYTAKMAFPTTHILSPVTYSHIKLSYIYLIYAYLPSFAAYVDRLASYPKCAHTVESPTSSALLVGFSPLLVKNALKFEIWNFFMSQTYSTIVIAN